MSVDYLVWRRLQSWAGEIAEDNISDTPPFVGSAMGSRGRRSKREWISAWLGREILAGPIWIVAILGGATVKWRGRKFQVGMDARVKEVGRGRVAVESERNEDENENGNKAVDQGKKRRD